jgi:uncharacterized protein (DUF433 family)
MSGMPKDCGSQLLQITSKRINRQRNIVNNRTLKERVQPIRDDFPYVRGDNIAAALRQETVTDKLRLKYF